MSNSSDVQRSFRCYGTRHPLYLALLCVGGVLPCSLALGQPYVRYDGSETADHAAALSSWTGAAEFKSDWGLAGMKAEYAYARGLSGAGVRLGAVDSGFLPSHQEFAARGIRALTATGRYRDAGSQLDGGGLSWRAGDAFDTPGVYQPDADLAHHVGRNDNHGNHVSGTIAAARNGVGMMGVAFGSQYAIANSNGTDASRYGSNMDYNYFHAAYDAVAASGARAINSSWGSPADADDYGSMDALAEAYARLEGAGKKTWLDAAADVAKERGVLHVWANGNAGDDNPSVRAGLPWFRPDIERYWIGVSTVDDAGKSYFNRCGVGKYWCVAAPGIDIDSASVEGVDKYQVSSGTSMSAPHVTGALGLLMERYPYLGNEEIRTILLTTASLRGAGPASVPDDTFGWGVPDLQRAMAGPAQLLGRFVADVPAGVSDRWANGIADTALKQRQVQESEELAAWPTELVRLQNAAVPVPVPAAAPAALIDGMPKARELVKAVVDSLVKETFEARRRLMAMAALAADPAGKALGKLYESTLAQWQYRYSAPGAFDAFIAGRSDTELATAIMGIERDKALAANARLPATIQGREARITALRARTAADYQSVFVKQGAGTLTLQGDSEYTGPTIVDGGELRIEGSIVSPATVHAGGVLVVSGRSGAISVDGGRASVDGHSAGVVVMGGGLLDGTGTLDSLRAGKGGIVAPGHSVGTLHVGGDVAFEPGSVYLLDLAAGASDRIVSSGQATLSGGTLAVGLAPAGITAVLGRQYDVLVAQAGVHGRFAGVRQPYVFLDGGLRYEAQRVTLALERNRTSFASMADTGNQRRVADAAEAAGVREVYEGVLRATSRADAVAAFGALSGEIYPALSGALMEDSRLVRDAMSARLDPARVSPAQQGMHAAGAWGQWLGARTRSDGDGDAEGNHSRSDGFLVGADAVLDGTRVGIVAGYGRSTLGLVGQQASAKADTYRLGVYAGRQVGAWGLRAGATYGGYHADVTRVVRFGGLADTNVAKVRGAVMQVFGEAGWRALATDRTLVEPYAGLAVVQARDRDFTEAGGPSALRGQRASHWATFATAGVRGEIRTAFDAGRQLSVRGGLGWRHALRRAAPQTTLAFAGASSDSPFTARGVAFARDAAVVDVTATLSLGANASVGLAYAALLAGTTHSHAVNANVAWRF